MIKRNEHVLKEKRPGWYILSKDLFPQSYSHSWPTDERMDILTKNVLSLMNKCSLTTNYIVFRVHSTQKCRTVVLNVRFRAST